MKWLYVNQLKKHVVFLLVFTLCFSSVMIPPPIAKAADATFDPNGIEVVIPESVGDVSDDTFRVKIQGKGFADIGSYNLEITILSLGKQKKNFDTYVFFLDDDGYVLNSSSDGEVYKNNAEVGKTYAFRLKIPYKIQGKVAKIVFQEHAVNPSAYQGQKKPADAAPWSSITEVVIPESVGDCYYDDCRASVRGIGFSKSGSQSYVYQIEFTILSTGKEKCENFRSNAYFLDQDGKVLNASDIDGMFSASDIEIGKKYQKEIRIPSEIQDKIAKLVFREHYVQPSGYTGQALPTDVSAWNDVEIVIPDSVGSDEDDERRARVRGLGFSRSDRYHFEFTVTSMGSDDSKSFTAYAFFLDKDGTVLNKSFCSGNYNYDSEEVQVGKTYSAYLMISPEVQEKLAKIVFRKHSVRPYRYYEQKMPEDVNGWENVEVVIPESIGDSYYSGFRAKITGIGFSKSGSSYMYHFHLEVISTEEDAWWNWFSSYAFFLDKDGKVLNRRDDWGKFGDYVDMGKKYTGYILVDESIKYQVAKIVFQKYTVKPSKYFGQMMPATVEPTPTPQETEEPESTEPAASPTPTKPSAVTPSSKPVLKKFKWGRDNLNFDNTNESFGYGRYYDMMDASYRSALKKKLSNIEKTTIFNKKTGWIYENWNGSCFGMSAVTFLAKAGVLSCNEFQKGTSKVSDFKLPKKNKKLESVINYYQMSQGTEAIQQIYYKHSMRSNKENIKALLSLLKKNETVMVAFEQKPWGSDPEGASHAVLAYGYKSGKYKYNGKTYDGCVEICDPNESRTKSQYHDECNLYFRSSTYEWVIPYYLSENVSSANGAKFNMILADQDLINHKGYLKGTSYVARLGADISSTQYSVQKMKKKGDGIYSSYDISGNDMVEKTMYRIGGGGEGYNLYDGESSYRLVRNETGHVDLTMNFEDIYLEGSAESGKSVTFDRDGKVELENDRGEYRLSILLNENYPTSWYQAELTGTGAEQVSLGLTEEGYICKGNSLKDVNICMKNDKESVSGTFSTDQDSVLVYEKASGQIGVNVDIDGNGIYETELEVTGNTKMKISDEESQISDASDSISVPTPGTPKLKASKAKIQVTWNQVSQSSGYEVQYSLKSDMKSSKQKKVSATKTSLTLKSLKRKKTYYIRIRAYLQSEGTWYYSKWSGIKKAKVK